MSHLLTGSDDGYIRDYDIFTALNGKTFLSAPQRHHAGVVEGLMKAGHLYCWWENPTAPNPKKLNGSAGDDMGVAPVYSLAMHSDALWALAGSDVRDAYSTTLSSQTDFVFFPLSQSGHVNLFTVRHEPGRLCHVMNGHRGPVSALALDYDEKSFFSAAWDGEAIVSLFTWSTLPQQTEIKDMRAAMGPEHWTGCSQLHITRGTISCYRSSAAEFQLFRFRDPRRSAYRTVYQRLRTGDTDASCLDTRNFARFSKYNVF